MSRSVFLKLQLTAFLFVFSLPLFGETFGFGGSLVDLQPEETLPCRALVFGQALQQSPDLSERKADVMSSLGAGITSLSRVF
ncbi:hypothetical protein PM082_013304 [Marasmius tenuissimus]|nr:hypothetical protein PM082_013304 [Marasmius tenuissimus]